MMSVLPDSDHVARYCGDQKCPDGNVQATAFLRRPLDAGLSVNWLEYYADCGDRRQALVRVVSALDTKGRSLGTKSWMTVLNVGRARKLVRQESERRTDLAFVHLPEPDDGSHSEIRGMEVGDEFVGELLAEACREEACYPVSALRQIK